MNIVLLGAPGSGKGTQSHFLCKEFDLTHLSTGDLLRNEIAKQTPLSQNILETINKGHLVSDELIADLVKKTIEESHTKGLLFDGFPRTQVQAQLLDSILEILNMRLDLVINLLVSREKVIERIVNRYTCIKCGAIYNTLTKPWDSSTKCDSCGASEFKQRSDDREEVVLERYKIYQDQCETLKDYYGGDRGIIFPVDGDQDVSVVWDDIKRETTKRLGR